jgi:microcystin-dependent protein
MSTPFLGELRCISFNFAPKGWALCNGQLLQINTNQALFSILGTTYGGDGRTTFALPNLQASTPIHPGNGFTLGQRGGEANHTLALNELPQHLHSANGSTGNCDASTPGGNFWGSNGLASYSPTTPPTSLMPNAIAKTGGSQAHPNTQPYLVINIIIALTGIFPSQN